MGRPSIKFSEEKRKTIKAMAGYGIPQKDIARVHGVSEKTLRLHCEHELATGATEATTKVAETLFGLATGGNVTACIFWMKTRAGWTERTELTGKGGKDLMPAGKISLEDRGFNVSVYCRPMFSSQESKVYHPNVLAGGHWAKE